MAKSKTKYIFHAVKWKDYYGNNPTKKNKVISVISTNYETARRAAIKKLPVDMQGADIELNNTELISERSGVKKDKEFKGVPNAKIEPEQIHLKSKSYLLKKFNNKWIIEKTFKTPYDAMNYRNKYPDLANHKLHFTFHDKKDNNIGKMPRLKKGSKEAKAFMAKLRAARSGKVGAKKKVTPKKKTPVKSYHKDTKSHNVNVRVVSGLDKVTRKGKKTSVHYSKVSGLNKVTHKGKKTIVHYSRLAGVGASKSRTMELKRLTQLATKSGNPLTRWVATSIKSNVVINKYDSLDDWFKDFNYSGLQSGMINSMIYYTDTLRFYTKFKKQILQLLKDTMMENGVNSPAGIFGSKWDNEDPFAEDTNNKNLLAWFGYEKTASELEFQLGY